ncbi:ABC transporter permease [Streptomyces alanosinicus]|uniref:ABC transporter n=1 Tax=Streptomyces alanosinicus TaxID=68171 RepID=A0A918YE13_9ACTN|nr:ABC transporter permease [Streptomyces alanosinicus]GHD99922.1 ABC transporter [Streptomyces alanosinicus]
MTATRTERTAPVAVSTGTRNGRAAVVALAGFEARRLLLRLPVLLALAGHVTWIVWRTLRPADDFPVLQDADRATQSGPLFVGLAVMLCANQAALRSLRRDTERHFAVTSLTLWRRTAAHVLSVVPLALLTAVAVTAQFTWEAAKPGAVGRGSVAELLAGPLTVLLFGTAGVLLARLNSSAVAGPLLVVAFLLLFVGSASQSGGQDTGPVWLWPVVVTSGVHPFPSDLLGRPAGWHALYLAGLALTVALLAVLVSGGRTRTVQAALAGALALAALGGVMQTGGIPAATDTARSRASLAPEQDQTCVRRGASHYCAFPEWTPRVEDWARIADRVQGLAGGAAHDRPLLVRQRLEARYGLSDDAALDPATRPDQVTVGTSWGGDRVPEFSTAVAGVLVAGNERRAGELCDGRMVPLMWLSLAWQRDPESALRHVRLDDSVTGSALVLSGTEPLTMTAGQTKVVRALLHRPLADVGARVKAHWDELTAPGVTTARAAELLGVRVSVGGDRCTG